MGKSSRPDNTSSSTELPFAKGKKGAYEKKGWATPKGGKTRKKGTIYFLKKKKGGKFPFIWFKGKGGGYPKKKKNVYQRLLERNSLSGEKERGNCKTRGKMKKKDRI